MDRDVTELPLIVFDDVDDEPRTSSLGQNENGSSPISASLSEDRVGQATVSVCGGSGGSQVCLEIDSTGQGEAPGSDKRMVEPGKDLDASGMEDMIQKILEKYGETEVQSGDAAVTPGRTATTSQVVTERRGAAKREADGSVSDMIRRESSKWDRVYGTEDIHAPGPTRDWTGRQEIHGRRSVPATEDTFQDVAIGSVIRSQTGVARQLISVSAGLDGINDDLEDMKRELKRIQSKDYTCIDGANDLVGHTTKEFAPIGCLKNAGTYRRKNEWVEERAGVVRFEDENSMQETERYLKTHQAPTSYLPGAGRAHIKESDVNLTHLLTIAEPVEPYRQTRSLVDDSAVKRERYIDADRFGRSSTQLISGTESSSKHGSHRKPDGYCNLCEEFDEISTKRRSLPTYEEPLRVPQRSHIHTYQSTPAYEDPYKVTLRSHNQTYQSTPTYGEASKVGHRPLHQTYQSTSSYEDPYKIANRSYDHTYRSTPAHEDPYKVTYGSNNHTYQSTPAIEDPYKVTHRSHNQTYRYQSTPAYEEPSKVSQRFHSQAYQSISTYEEPSKVVYRSRNHTYDPSTIAGVDQNSHHRSREDLGGIYKTPSGIYFYSDAIRSYSDQATLDPDGGNMRSFARQSSVPPRAYQSHISSFVRQSSVPPRGYQSHSSSPVASQSHRSSVEFTSRFLTKVRNRRNSLGGRIDTDSYGAQTLKGY